MRAPHIVVTLGPSTRGTGANPRYTQRRYGVYVRFCNLHKFWRLTVPTSKRKAYYR